MPAQSALDRASDAGTGVRKLREDGQAQAGYAAIVLDRDGAILHGDGDEMGRRFIQSVVVGENILVHIHPEDTDVFEALRKLAPSRGERTATLEIRWARGPDRWSRLFATIGQQDDGGTRLVLAGDEATVARRAEAQMRRVIEGSAQGIIVRTQSKILYMNDSFARLVGYESAHDCMASEPKYANSMIHADDLEVVENLPTHQDIANMINTSRETVTRALLTLVQQGIVEKDAHRLIIRNPQALQKLADAC